MWVISFLIKKKNSDSDGNDDDDDNDDKDVDKDGDDDDGGDNDWRFNVPTARQQTVINRRKICRLQ